jgi:hypothetical protein
MFSQQAPTSFDSYRELVKTRQGVEWNNVLLGDISDSLVSIHAEIAQARRISVEALAIQQELLSREVIQGKLEEFIYQLEKMVNEFQKREADVVPSTQYFLLLGVLKTIQSEGISTAIIRGRDNKAAFETAVSRASTLHKQLQAHPEVQQAITWAKEEQKRLDDRRAAEEEAGRKKADEEERIRRQQAEAATKAKEEHQAQITSLHQRIEKLKVSKKKLEFNDWYKKQFAFLDKYEPPVLYALHGAIWCFGGWICIPAKYWFDAKAADQQMNPEINGEIKSLEQQLQGLERQER